MLIISVLAYDLALQISSRWWDSGAATIPPQFQCSTPMLHAIREAMSYSVVVHPPAIMTEEPSVSCMQPSESSIGMQERVGQGSTTQE